MSENASACEWLRGIVDKYEANGAQSCSALAKMFGIDCDHERTCRYCMLNMMTIIADRIDRETVRDELLKKENAELADWKGNAEGFQPDSYMKLPLDADGKPIRIGDVLYSSGNECHVVSITVKTNEACVGVHTDEGTFLPSVNPKYLSHKKLEVFDADGVLIKVGDTVYCDDDPEPLQVELIYAGSMGYCTVKLKNSEGRYTSATSADGPRLSHKKPELADSWEKLEKDANQPSCWYFGIGSENSSCDYCSHGSKQTGRECWQNVRLDIVRRAKALAKADEKA